MKKILFGLFLICQSACQITQTRSSEAYDQFLRQTQEAAAISEKCYKEIDENTPQGKSVFTNFLKDLDDPDMLAKISIDRYLTEEEKINFIEYHSMLIKCKKLDTEEFPEIWSEYLNKQYKLLDDLMIAVIADEIKIGQANRQYRDLILSAEEEANKLFQTITQEYYAAHYQEANKYNAYLKSFLEGMEKSLKARSDALKRQIEARKDRDRRTYDTNCTSSGDDNWSCTSKPKN